MTRVAAGRYLGYLMITELARILECNLIVLAPLTTIGTAK